MIPASETARPIRVVIVDDEPLARARIRSLLLSEPEVVVVGECTNGEEAVATIAAERPDLAFLDIQMPEIDGFDVVEAIGVDSMPLVIFVTAHNDRAVEAFDVLALDYLLKPVDRDRFARTLQRAKVRLRSAAPDAGHAQLQPLIDQLSRRQRRDLRLAIKVDGRVMFIRTTDIDWIEAVDNHARIHLGTTSHIVRNTMARLEERLPSGRFLRIQRSTIVNVDRIRTIEPWFQGDYVFILTDGTRLTSGRSYRQRVQDFVNDAL